MKRTNFAGFRMVSLGLISPGACFERSTTRLWVGVVVVCFGLGAGGGGVCVFFVFVCCVSCGVCVRRESCDSSGVKCLCENVLSIHLLFLFFPFFLSFS